MEGIKINIYVSNQINICCSYQYCLLGCSAMQFAKYFCVSEQLSASIVKDVSSETSIPIYSSICLQIPHSMILIIISIRNSYLTFNVRVINGRETWPLTLREEPRQRVSRRILKEDWKICIMGSIICGIQHVLYNDQVKRGGGFWECNTQEERIIAYIPLFIRRI